MKEKWMSKSIFNWWPWTRKNIAPICIWSSRKWNVHSKAIRWFKMCTVVQDLNRRNTKTPQEYVSATFETLSRDICWVLGAKCTNLIPSTSCFKKLQNVIYGFMEMLFFTLGSFLKIKWMKIWREDIAHFKKCVYSGNPLHNDQVIKIFTIKAM